MTDDLKTQLLAARATITALSAEISRLVQNVDEIALINRAELAEAALADQTVRFAQIEQERQDYAKKIAAALGTDTTRETNFDAIERLHTALRRRF